jgi:hypothetical protein
MTRPPALPPDLPPSRLDYADVRSSSTSIDWYAFTRHLIGWAVFGTLLLVMVLQVIPRFEDIFKDFRLDLPAPTKTLLALSRRPGVFLVVLAVPFAIAHAFAAAAWYPHSTRLGRFMYRLVVLLLIAAIVTFVVLALFLPYMALIEGISGSKK